MAANKRFWFSSFFSTPGMALEAMFHAASENLSTNADAGNLECLAKVVTRPIPLSNRGGGASEILSADQSTGNPPQGGTPGAPAPPGPSSEPAAGEGAHRYARFKFFARIETEGEKQYSEHSLLEETCRLDSAADKYSVACLTSLTVMVYSAQEYYGILPKIGDSVKIKLRPGDVHRDIQHADLITLDLTAEISQGSSAEALVCNVNLGQRLAEIFDGQLLDSVGSGKTEPTPHFDPIIPAGTPSQFPTRGSISSGFTYYRCIVIKGVRKCAPHPGQDLAAAKGTSIYPALNNGIVVGFNSEYINGTPCQEGDGGCGSGFGNYIRIKHNIGGKTIHTSYNHLSAINVSIGDQVDMNTKIGEVGHTGRSTGAHLHWEVFDGAITRRHRMPDGAHGDPNRMSHADPTQALRLEQQIASAGRVGPGGTAPA
jgi:murein DD-endopeptidase MepM/ murein hydrolase activator NlpD